MVGILTTTQQTNLVNVMDLMMWTMPIVIMAYVFFTFTRRRCSIWEMITPMAGLMIGLLVMNAVVGNILPEWTENTNELTQNEQTIQQQELARQDQIQQERKTFDEQYNITKTRERPETYDNLDIFNTGDL